MIVSSSASKSLDSNRSGSEHNKELFDVLYTLSYGESFSPFRIMRNGDHEIRHSNVLAWLFDKNAKNNIFGNGFAVSFFSSVEAYKGVNWDEKFREEIIVDTEVASDVKPFQEYLNNNPQIRAEYEGINKKRQSKKKNESTDDVQVIEADCSVIEDASFDNNALRNKRIDILIIGETFTCTIENKIHAGEHDWQCQYYKHYINDKYPDRENYFVFLDIDKPDNWDDETLIYQGYELVTYEGVITILNELINGKEESDTIRFIEQYIDTLDELYEYVNTLSSYDLLVIDDFGLMELDMDKCRDLFEVIEPRDSRKSTMIVSQLPVVKWWDLFKDNTYADACLSRMTSKAYRLECNGRDMRKSQ